METASIPKRIYLLLALSSILYFFANFQRAAIPGAVFNEIQQYWQLSAVQVTSLGTTFMYVYAIGQLVVGAFTAKFGGIRVILTGGLIFVIGSLMFQCVPGYFMLCLSRLLGGMGSGCIYLGTIAIIMRFFNKNYALIISFMIMTGYAGGVVANAPFTWAVSHFGLKAMLWTAAIATAVIYFSFFGTSLFISKPAIKKVNSPLQSIWQALKKKHNILIFTFSACNWGLYYSLQTVIGKKYLEDFCELPQSVSAMLISATSIISAIAGFLYAVGSQRLGNRRRPFCKLTAIITPIVFLLLNICVLFDIRNFIPAVLLLCLAAVSSLSTTLIPILKETNTEDNTGSAIALLNFFSYFAVAVFGNIIGWCLERFPAEHTIDKIIYSRESYMLTFAIMGIAAVVVFFCGMSIKETNGKFLEVK